MTDNAERAGVVSPNQKLAFDLVTSLFNAGQHADWHGYSSETPSCWACDTIREALDAKDALIAAAEARGRDDCCGEAVLDLAAKIEQARAEGFEAGREEWLEQAAQVCDNTFASGAAKMIRALKPSALQRGAGEERK